MPLPPGSESGRRLLIVAGTANFKHLNGFDLPHVPEELDRIEKSFNALGYERQQAAFSFNPESGQLRTLFAEVKKASRAEDIIVAYYTGHGARDAERFYLLAGNSSLSDLDGTAVPAEDLARALTKNSEASQVLVILDACYAGAGAAEFTQISNRLAALIGVGPAIFVVAAARPKQEAEQGALSSALAEALANNNNRLGGRAQAFLAMDDVMDAVDTYLRDKHPAQTATWSSANVRGRCRLFPNPNHRQEVPPGLDLETQRAFVEHWVPKARGAELGAAGWYFTGREQALRELAAWLSGGRSDGGMRIVTGAPGCGKSAVLARVVTLADPTYRKEVLATTRSAMLDPATLPPEGVVDVAVHARHKLLADIVAQIAASLGLAARDSISLLAALGQRAEKTVIVLDALDEADEKDQIVSRLLRPMAELPQIYLLVGTRPDSSEHGKRFRALGEAAVEIDLDDPRFLGTDDVALYVERRLLATEEPRRSTPYRHSPEIAHTVARAVAERAGGAFLIAHTAVHTLLAAKSIVDVTQPGWVDQLPTGLDEAFAQFLAQIDARRPGGLSSATACAVLLPLAFAEGEGLPWVDLWAATASTLAASMVSDADVALVREHAAAFIVEGVEQDRSVYRLYHERLAEQLRGSVPDANEAQQRIVEVLRSRVPHPPNARGLDWARAHPYVLTHLAAHALKAGKLGKLVMDGIFVATASPLRTLQALSASTDPQARRVYACYSLVFDRLRDEPMDVRLSYLQMTARQQGDHDLAEIWRGDALSCRWTVPWARWKPSMPHRTILTKGLTSAALGTLDGRPVIVSGGWDSTVRVWDLASGKPHGEPLRGHEGAVASIAVGILDNRPVIVSGGHDSTVRVWDLASGKPHGEPLREFQYGVESVAVGTLDARPVIVCREIACVSVWDLASGNPHGEPLRDFRHGFKSVAVGTLDGRPVIVSGGDSTVRVWDLASGKPHGEPLRGHDGGVTSVTVGTLENRPVIVSGGEDSTVRVWDLASGEPHGEPLRGHGGDVTSVAVGMLDGRPVVMSCDYESMRVWDLSSARPSRIRANVTNLSQHAERLLGLGFRASIESLVSPLIDRLSRPSRRPSFVPVQLGPGYEYAVASLASGTLDSRPIIVSGGFDSTVRVWDLATGKPRGRPLRGHQGIVKSIALGTLEGRPVILSGGEDETVRIWDLASGKPQGRPLRIARYRLTEQPTSKGKVRREVRDWVISLGLITLEGRSVIVSGLHNERLQLWNVVSGAARDQTAQPWDFFQPDQLVHLWGAVSVAPGRTFGQEGSMWSTALATLDGRPVIVSGGHDSTVRVWDLASGKPHGEPLRGHDGGVTSVAVGTLDGRPVIISAGQDLTVRLWDAGKVVFSVGVASRVRALAIAQRGTIVVAADNGLLPLQFE